MSNRLFHIIGTALGIGALLLVKKMTETVMCYDQSWFTAQEQKKTQERKPEMKGKRTIDALLRQSNEQAQKAAADHSLNKEPAPAK